MNYKKYIENHIIRCDAGYRGGGVEIDMSSVVPQFDEPKMASYQNYLGGGMLGRICNNCNFDTESLTPHKQKLVFALAEELNKYLYEITSEANEEVDNMSYERNQTLPVSAY